MSTCAPPTPVPTPSPSEVESHTYRVMMAEFVDFEEVHADSAAGFAHPLEPGGLPTGWVMAARGEPWDSLTHLGNVMTSEVCLVHREAGGWGLVLHQHHADGPARGMLMSLIGSTVPVLHECVWAAHPTSVAVAGRQTIRSFALSHYDLTDPVEAAEATLVGLGGPIAVFPSSMTE